MSPSSEYAADAALVTGPTEMIGRAGPLAELLALHAEAARGRGRAALILGEAGMGKSTLVEALVDHADARSVAWGWAGLDAPPYAVWRTALEALLPDHPLRERVPVTGEDGSAARHRLFAAVRQLLVETATQRGMVVLVLEDLHWADRPSLALLHSLVEGLRGVPVLVVATARDEPGETGPEVAADLANLPTSMLRLPLFGLNEGELGDLLCRVVGGAVPDEVVAALRQRTGGNPFFAREVARLMRAQGSASAGAIPPGVREAIRRRLARLSEPVHRILAIAAVAAGPREAIDVSTVARAAGLSTVEVVEFLDGAVQAKLLTAEPRFAHALVREVVEAGLPAAQVGQLHALIAVALVDRGGPAAAIAAHWSRAVHPDAATQAGRWSLLAAREATRHLGFEAAVAAYERALDAPGIDRLTVLVELGQARRMVGDLSAARGTLLDAAALARAEDRPTEFAQAVLGLGGGVAGFEVAVHDGTQAALLEEALTRLPDNDSALRAAVLARLSLALTAKGQVPQRIALAEQAVAMARRCGDPSTEVGALAAYCDAVSGIEYARARLGAARRCRVLAEAAGDQVGLLLALRLGVVALLELGDFATADAEAATYERAAGATGVPLYQWLPPIWRATRAILRGDIDEAWQHIAHADELGHRAGSENADMMVLSARITVHLAQHTMPELLDDLRPVVGMPWASAASGAWLFHLAGDVPAAARMLSAVTIAEIPVDSEWAPSLWAAGLVAIELGDLARVRDAYDALAPHADLWIVDGIGAGVYGVIADALGRFAAALGELDRARRWLTQARTAYQAAGAVLLAAATDQALATLGPQSIVELPISVPIDLEPAELVREGRTWRVSFRGRTASVADSKGLRDLAALLATPGREVHVLDLVDGTGTARATASDTGETLDATARAAYRSRLTELADELADAEADGDLGRVERLRHEHDFLVAELTAALGLHGRARTGGDPAEKARKAVTMRIGTALRALEDVHPALARHLRLAVGTGRFCSYRPEQVVRWTVRT